jgi:hypothetical protein
MMRPMMNRLLLLIALAAAPLLATAQEKAFTNRATDLKDKAAPEARTLASLPAETEVKVLGRGGQWTQVEALSQRGWVRVFHLRFPTTVQEGTSSGGSALGGLTSAFGFGRQTAKSSTVATTGIRGLTPEDFANASPDAEALRRLQSYRADKPAAERFAREGKLAAQQIDYSEARR